MAWLEQTAAGAFHVAFRFQGEKYKKSLRTRDERTVFLHSDELNDVPAIPVNQDIIEKLNGHRWQPKGPATSIALYVRQDDGAGGQYHDLRSSNPPNTA